MIHTQFKNLNRSNFESSSSDNCFYCSQPDQSTLDHFCDCPTRSHLNCLIRHIQSNRISHCGICLIPFRNVRIIYSNRSPIDWLREDVSTRESLIRILTFFVLIVYLQYLSVIQMSVQYQIMFSFEKYVLEFLIFCFFYFIIMITIFTSIFIIGSYFNFRQTTGQINVIPLNQASSSTAND